MSTRQPPAGGRLALRKVGIVLLVLALAAGAGCSSVLDGGGSGSADPIDNVPENQNVLIEVDMDVTTDDTTRSLLEESEEDEAPSDDDLNEGLDEFEQETGLDLRDVNSILLFGETDDVANPTGATPSDEQFGVIVSTDWSQSDLTETFEQQGDAALTEVDYEQSGVLYRVDSEEEDEPLYLGALGGGNFVFGDEAAVRASLDTEYAGASSVGGDVREAYDNARDGLLTFAVDVPPEQGSSEFGELHSMSAVYYTDGDTVGFEARLATDSEQTAGLIATNFDAAIGSQIEDPEVIQALEPLSVSSDGSDAVFTYETDVDTLIELSES